MQARRQLPPAIEALARRQGGVVTVGQLDASGITRRIRDRMTNSGILLRIHDQSGLLCTRAPDLKSRLWAGILLAGDPSALGGWHALHVMGADVRPSRLAEPIQIWVEPHRSLRPKGPWRFRRDFGDRLTDRFRLDSKNPWTIPNERSFLDISLGLEAQACVGLALDLLRDGGLRPAFLTAALTCQPHRHRRLLLDVIADHEQGIHSMLEQHYARDVEAAHKLATGSRQVQLRGGFADVVYTAHRVIVELDGRAFHRDRFRDARRDNANALAGYETLRYGWTDVVGDPCLVAEQVARRLRARGWKGRPTPCHRCA